jgi:hypothetical protein
MSIYSWIYAALLTVILIIALIKFDPDYTTITSILIFAFVITRLITYYNPESRIYFDFANDILACLLLIYFVKENNLAKAVIGFYIVMWMVVYYPTAFEITERRYYEISIDILAYLQAIVVILGGYSNGTRINTDLQYDNYSISKTLGDIPSTSFIPFRGSPYLVHGKTSKNSTSSSDKSELHKRKMETDKEEK